MDDNFSYDLTCADACDEDCDAFEAGDCGQSCDENARASITSICAQAAENKVPCWKSHVCTHGTCFHGSGTVLLEEGIPYEVAEELVGRGHTVKHGVAGQERSVFLFFVATAPITVGVSAKPLRLEHGLLRRAAIQAPRVLPRLGDS